MAQSPRPRSHVTFSAIFALAAIFAGPFLISAAPPPRALIVKLNAALLTHDSATATLTRWCADRHLADPPVIHAVRLQVAESQADALPRRQLSAAPGEAVRHRHVRLVCGAITLSEADNWYLPARLTPEMNLALDHSDRPFGLVVASLNFRRQTLAVTLPRRGPFVIVHRALLTTTAGPFSFLVERYTKAAVRSP